MCGQCRHFSAPGIIAADKGAVLPRTAILVGEFLCVVTHLESAVSTVDKAGKNAFISVRSFLFPHTFLVYADHCIPYLAGNDCLMCTLYTNPFVLRLADQLAGFIGHCSCLALHHVANIDFIADKVLYSGIRPSVIDAAGVILSFPLVV